MAVDSGAATVEPLVMRRTMGGFATGVAVVTTQCDAVPHGMTVNSLTSVSLDPPLLLVCLTIGSRTAHAVQRRGAFVVNFLSERQEDLATRFARPGGDHFVGIALERTDLGLPALPRTLGRVECDVDAMHPAGDHIVVIGRVRSCAYRDGSPLVFYRGRYHRLLDTGHQARWYW